MIDAANQRESYQKWRLMRNIKKTKQTPHQRHQREAGEKSGKLSRKKIGKKRHLLFVGTGIETGRQKIKSRISHLINFVRLSKRRMALPLANGGSGEKALKLHHQAAANWGREAGGGVGEEADADGIDDVVVCAPLFVVIIIIILCFAALSLRKSKT